VNTLRTVVAFGARNGSLKSFSRALEASEALLTSNLTLHVLVSTFNTGYLNGRSVRFAGVSYGA
jgi:hypothetical protein